MIAVLFGFALITGRSSSLRPARSSCNAAALLSRGPWRRLAVAPSPADSCSATGCSAASVAPMGIPSATRIAPCQRRLLGLAAAPWLISAQLPGRKFAVRLLSPLARAHRAAGR